MTGRSRGQVTRWIARYRETGSLQPAPYRRHRFPQRYTRADVELLAAVDEAHENLSGPATRRILEREYRQYGKPQYERLSAISVAHLYNLRQRPHYRERRLCYTRTRPTAVTIGERRCPDPQGQPGYLRVDTVHQGDAPAGQGVYHINAVDQVTQWEIVAATERISEAWLEPVLCALLRQFPFRILGFHSDNGSEFINRIVARLLNKLLIEQTKSRPRHSNDNGLAETKNGAVIRKHMGTATSRPGTPCACSSSTPPTSIPISTTIVRAPKPTSPSTRKAVGAASTAAIRPRWRPCWPCPTRRNICAPDSPPPSYNASREPAATPKPRSACSRRNAASSRRCAEPWEGRGNDGSEKSPNPKSGDFSLPWKAQNPKPRFPHSHRPGYGC